MSNISEIRIGSIIRVKVGRNTILAKVLEVHEDSLRVCSVSKNKEFNVPSSRVELDGEQAPENAADETATENTEATEQAEQPADMQDAEAESNEDDEEPQTEGNQDDAGTPATIEVVPEDEAAEFTPSGEDEEDEYAINPAHESDKPVKRLSLLDAAVIVLKNAGPDHPMNTKEILEAIVERQLWSPTPGKTPEQTLYGSIFREINTKEHPRIVKSDVKGKFRIAE